MHCVHVEAPGGGTRELGPVEKESWGVVSHHVGAEN